GEAVVGESGVPRHHPIPDPAELTRLSRGYPPRVVDLEASRQMVGDDDAGELRLRLGDLEHDREAIVLPRARRINRLAIERVVEPLDLEATLGRGLRHGRRTTHREHRSHRAIASVGHRYGASTNRQL